MTAKNVRNIAISCISKYALIIAAQKYSFYRSSSHPIKKIYDENTENLTHPYMASLSRLWTSGTAEAAAAAAAARTCCGG